MNDLIIAGASVVTPTGVLANRNVLIRDGKIAHLNLPVSAREGVLSIDGKGQYLFAGFVDLHVHGGGGADFMDATREDFELLLLQITGEDLSPLMRDYLDTTILN
jgi:N-acetylglucosamine-6-phosphate deacetylase